MRTKLIQLFGICILLFASADLSAQIRMRMPDTTAVADSSFIDIPVYADSSLTGKGIYSYQIQFTYSDYMLKPVSVSTAGTVLNGTGMPSFNKSVSGKITISGAVASPLSGQGVFIYVRFQKIRSSSTWLAFTGIANNYFNEGEPAMILNDGYCTLNTLPVVTVYPETGLLVKGEQMQFQAYGGAGVYTWSTSDTTLATISQSGILTAKKHGLVKAIATDINNIKDFSGNIEIRPVLLSLHDTSAYSSDTLLLPVYTSDMTGLDIVSGNFDLEFSSTVFTPIGFKKQGTLLENYADPVINTETAGKMQVSFAGSVPVAGQGVLLYLKLKVKSGSSWLYLRNMLFNEELLAKSKDVYFYETVPPTLYISGGASELFVGDSLTFTANGGVPPYQFSTTDPSISAISSSGKLTASAGGTIKVKLKDSKQNQAISGDIQIYDTKLRIGSINAEPGTTVDVPVYISKLPAGQSVLSFEFSLNYLKPELALLGVITTGSLSEGWSASSNESNNIANVAAAGTAGINQEGVLCYLRFKTTLDLTNGENGYINFLNAMLNEGAPLTKRFNGAIVGLQAILRDMVTLNIQYPPSCFPTSSEKIRSTLYNTGNNILQPGDSLFPFLQMDGNIVSQDTLILANEFHPYQQLTHTYKNAVNISADGQYKFKAWALLKGDVNHTNDTTQLTHTSYEKRTVSIGNDTAICDGSVLVLTASGSGSYYDWFRNDTLINGYAGNQLSVTQPGMYRVDFIYGSNCRVSSDEIQVTTSAVPAKPVFTVTGNPEFCGGDSVLLQYTGFLTYKWFKDGQQVSDQGNGKLAAKETGLYHVRAYNSFGCSTPSDTIQVTVNPVPDKPAIIADRSTTLCSDDSVTLTSSAETGNLWSTGAITRSIVVKTAGKYTVKVTSDKACSSTSDTTQVFVTVATKPVITADGPTTFCEGDSVKLSSSAAADNTWSNGATSHYIIVKTSGKYAVTAGDGSCARTSDTVQVIVNPKSNPIITAGGATTFCQGDSVILTSSELTGNKWSNGATTRSITVKTSGSYSVEHTAANSCKAKSNVIEVTVNTPAKPVITADGPLTFCEGDSVKLTSDKTSGNTWSTGATGPFIIVKTSGKYTVKYGIGGCERVSDTVEIKVNSNPSPVITPNGPTAFCMGDSVILTSSELTGNKWSTGAMSRSITVKASGSYSVEYTDANSCKGTSNVIEVVVNTPVKPVVTADGPLTFCEGDSVKLSSSATAGNTWSTGATNQHIFIKASGKYTVKTGTGACERVSDTVQVVVHPNPVVTITPSGATTFCEGDSVILTSSQLTGNQWSTGATTRSITVKTSGFYSVEYTDANSCTGKSNVIEVAASAPVKPVITADGPLTFCEGDSVKLTSDKSFGNTWSTGETGVFITVKASGKYTVKTGSGACERVSDTVEVKVNTKPAPVITASGVTTFCEGDSVTLTSSALTGNKWSTGATTRSIIVKTAGFYSVEHTDANSCKGTSNIIEVKVNAKPVPVITANGPTTFCQGDSVTLTSSELTNNKWSTGATTRSIVVKASGFYSVEYTDANSCKGTSNVIEVVVTTPAKPVITADGPLTFCEGDSVKLTSDKSTGNVWSTGETTPFIIVKTPGKYSVKNGAGACIRESDSVEVSVNSNPNPAVTAGGPLSFCEGDSVILTSSYPNGNEWYKDNIAIPGANQQTLKATQSGEYTVKNTDANTCSAFSAAVTVDVKALPAKPVITQVADTLFSSSANGNQWYHNDTILPGATDSRYEASYSGVYKVLVTDAENCSIFSDPYTFIYSAAPALQKDIDLNVYPNPAEGPVFISYAIPMTSAVEIGVYNELGVELYLWKEAGAIPGQYTHPVQLDQPGIYLIRIRVNEQFTWSRVIIQ